MTNNVEDVFQLNICYLCVQLQFMGTPNMQHEDHGLIFRSFIYLFHLLKQRQAQEKTQFILKASFLEIYNEKVSWSRNNFLPRRFPSSMI